jgi:hypothetical protein
MIGRTMMKYAINSIIVCCVLLASPPLAHAEDVETFLKRFGTGATKNDMDEHFRGMVFSNGELFEVDREKILKNVEGQKAAGTKLVVDELKILSKTETTDKDGKGAVISVVLKVSVTETVGGATLKIQSEDHHIIRRDAEGAFHALYFVVAKQVRPQ